MTYYIADTHFFHNAIIRLCSRPFSDADEMNEALIRNWNRKVTDNDTVYIVGDVAHKARVGKVVGLLKRLNGKKVLIIGNHDGGFLDDPDFRAEFKEIVQMKKISDQGKAVFLCHYPIAEWPGYYSGALHVYGHIHNKVEGGYKLMREVAGAYNAGAEVVGYEPVTLEELIRKNREFYCRNS